MSDPVAKAYDDVAERYASLFLDDLVSDVDAQPWVREFVGLVDREAGPVVDVGCGPGQGVDLLTRLGLSAFGIDSSAGQLEQARAAFPERAFQLGDLTDLDAEDRSLGGVLSRYSVIHVDPERLSSVFTEWARVLSPGAPVVLFFFASLEPAHHGRPFDHKVTTAYELFPETVARLLADAGFEVARTGSAPPAEGGRPFGKGAVLAQRSHRS